MRVVPSAATCVSGLVGIVAFSVFLKNCHRRIYTKFAFFGSGIPSNFNNIVKIGGNRCLRSQKAEFGSAGIGKRTEIQETMGQTTFPV
jgi:hypothetical protein